MRQRTGSRRRRGTALLLAVVAIPLVMSAVAVLVSDGAVMRGDTSEAIASASVRQLLASGQAWVRMREEGEAGESHTLPTHAPSGFTAVLKVTWENGPHGANVALVSATVEGRGVRRVGRRRVR
jgi:hypothetical protein